VRRGTVAVDVTARVTERGCEGARNAGNAFDSARRVVVVTRRWRRMRLEANRRRGRKSPEGRSGRRRAVPRSIS